MENYGKPKVYIATAQAFDDEMRDRINGHKIARGDGWRLIEAPMTAAETLGQVGAGEVALLDCATMWLTNQLLAETDLEQAVTELMNAIRTCPGDLVIVSNEVGLSIVPETALARRFRDEQGALNFKLAALSDLSVLVAAGLPLLLKGNLPDGMT